MTDRPLVLIISHVLPVSPAAGNEIRIQRMMAYLRSRGFRIALLLNSGEVAPPVRQALKSMTDGLHILGEMPDEGVRVSHSRAPAPVSGWRARLSRRRLWAEQRLGWGSRLWGEAIRYHLCPDKLVWAAGQLARDYRPAAVITEYIFTSWCLEELPAGLLTIVDTIDMFSLKRRQVVRHGVRDPLHCSRAEERAHLLRSDVIMAIQNREAALFRELVPEREVITVGIDCEPVLHPSPMLEEDPLTMLVVGSDNPLNVHGLRQFHRHAWLKIIQRRPDARLRVLGKLGLAAALADPTVQTPGWVPDLAGEYRRAALVLNPTVAGTGLKIKSVEALCHGAALVSTVNGVEGIDHDGEPPYLVCQSWRDFVSATLRLLDSPDERSDLRVRALAYSQKHFKSDGVYAPLVHVLTRRGF